MNQSTRAPSGKKSAGKTPSSTTEDTEKKGRRRGFLIASLIIVVLAIAIGIGYYLIYVRPLQTKIIVVGEDSINIGYFIKRLRMEITAGVGGDPTVMLETLTHEILVRQGAPRYGIEATDDDIDETLREIARGQSEAISDSEFNSIYMNAQRCIDLISDVQNLQITLQDAEVSLEDFLDRMEQLDEDWAIFTF